MLKNLRKFIIRVGNRYSADEIYLKIAGLEKYLFGVLDRETRFLLAWEIANRKDGHNASEILRAAAAKAGKVPTEFTSDSLPSYQQAHREVYEQKNPQDPYSTHVCDAGLAKKQNNNAHERLYVFTSRLVFQILCTIQARNHPTREHVRKIQWHIP